MKLALIPILIFTANVYGSPVKLSNIEKGWTVHTVVPGTEDAKISGNSDAIINFNETANGTLATVYVFELPTPANLKLGEDTEPWHGILFGKAAKTKVSVVSERTYNVNGQWRYIIEFQPDTGTMLNSIAMATLIDGKLHVMSLEQNRTLFNQLASSVRKLMKNVEIAPEPTAKEQVKK